MEGTFVSLLTPREKATYACLSLLLRKNVFGEARELRRRAEWSVETLDRFRIQRLRDVLMHAERTVPYYRELLSRCGVDAAGVQSFDDLERVAPLTRDVLRARFSDLRSEIVPQTALIRRSTGGTSGKPVTVLLDRALESERMLVNHRMYAMMGRTLGRPTLMIAGSPIDAAAWTSTRDRIKNAVFGIEVASSFNLTSVALQKIVANLRSHRYDWVIAYASVFDILAARFGGSLRIANIIPCAELVSNEQRERWRQAFDCEIFEIYGSREMTSIAGETTEHDGLAVMSDVYHVEITDAAGRRLPDGTPGLITVTTLSERGMPLLRYQLGDVGVLTPPPGGSRWPFPRLRITHGRVLDVICCPNGKLLPGEFFPHLMKEVEVAVERFQVVQTELDRLLVRVVPKEAWSEDTANYLRGHIQEQMGAEVLIEFEIVDEIESSGSGKYRPTICMLPESSKRFGSG
jgi:phenylacetate-CoA ligase